jgi:rhamnose utilization protein RhaD (predicted bifunctional aldolase and dehydrogenase)
MRKPPDIEILIDVSRRYGSDPTFLLAGGGNTSVKYGDRLWIKASGHALATIAEEGFVELDRTRLDAMLASRWPSDADAREAAFVDAVMDARVHPELNQRPSVETLLHHLLPDRFVVHTHPRIVNALSCCVHGPELSESSLGNQVLWQPYVDPGLVLAQSLHTAIETYAQNFSHAPQAVILANHGLIISGDSIAHIQRITNNIVEKIDHDLSVSKIDGFDGDEYQAQPDLIDLHERAIRKAIPGSHTACDTSLPILRLVGSSAGRDAALAGPLSPDHIVYCRSMPMWIQDSDGSEGGAVKQWRHAHDQYHDHYGFEPWIGLIAGVGAIAIRHTQAMAKTTCEVYLDAAHVYYGAVRLGGIQVMSDRNRRFIENWEVESYRRNIAETSR